MKTFIVEKEVVRHATRYEVASDGSLVDKLGWSFDYAEPQTVGFLVQVFEGEEYIESKYYPVYNNESEVFEQIKTDFPPEEYQNNEW